MTWSQGTVVLENDRIRSANLLAPIEGLHCEEPKVVDERAGSPVVTDIRGHRAIIEDFIRAIVSDGVPLCDGRDARRSVRLVNAIYDSSKSGLAVSIESSRVAAERV